jgi:hypothetical protein
VKGQLITLAAKLLELQALSFSAVLTRTIILAATSTAFKRHHDSLLTLGHFFFPSGIMALPIIKYTIKPGYQASCDNKNKRDNSNPSRIGIKVFSNSARYAEGFFVFR